MAHWRRALRLFAFELYADDTLSAVSDEITDRVRALDMDQMAAAVVSMSVCPVISRGHAGVGAAGIYVHVLVEHWIHEGEK
jgi:hypothetical protein